MSYEFLVKSHGHRRVMGFDISAVNNATPSHRQRVGPPTQQGQSWVDEVGCLSDIAILRSRAELKAPHHVGGTSDRLGRPSLVHTCPTSLGMKCNGVQLKHARPGRSGSRHVAKGFRTKMSVECRRAELGRPSWAGRHVGSKGEPAEVRKGSSLHRFTEASRGHGPACDRLLPSWFWRRRLCASRGTRRGFETNKRPRAGVVGRRRGLAGRGNELCAAQL